jgi:hypothetical protein
MTRARAEGAASIEQEHMVHVRAGMPHERLDHIILVQYPRHGNEQSKNPTIESLLLLFFRKEHLP